jgi:hypothetical protein
MSREAELYCRCREVRGRVKDASPETANRVVCYCDDCQAFLQHLGRTDLLDDHGGTDIVQVAPASLTFDRGSERIVGVRLSPKGLYRWYASCCKTPLGNSVVPAIPFVGIVAQVFDGTGATADAVFGKPAGAIWGKFAIGTAPEGSTKLNLGLIARSVRKIFGWRFGGKTWPHPFFDRATRLPRYPLTTLSRAERDALRSHCGPHPSSSAENASSVS